MYSWCVHKCVSVTSSIHNLYTPVHPVDAEKIIRSTCACVRHLTVCVFVCVPQLHVWLCVKVLVHYFNESHCPWRRTQPLSHWWSASSPLSLYTQKYTHTHWPPNPPSAALWCASSHNVKGWKRAHSTCARMCVCVWGEFLLSKCKYHWHTETNSWSRTFFPVLFTVQGLQLGLIKQKMLFLRSWK